MTLTDALSRLEAVRPCGNGYIARCPAHGDRKPSLSMRQGNGGKLLLKCHAGCDYWAIVAGINEQLGRILIGSPGSNSIPAPFEQAKRIEQARWIWRESRPAVGSLVETYLRKRGITIALPPSLRFHPSLRHRSHVFGPALVAKVQDRDGKLVAIHRTFLATDGCGKATLEPSKMGLGPIAGSAVRLKEVAEKLALAEGIETALSLQQAIGIATWAALGASNLSRVELPDFVREVIIAADNDEAGERAAQAAAHRFYFEGRKVRICRPRASNDFNDRLIA